MKPTTSLQLISCKVRTEETSRNYTPGADPGQNVGQSSARILQHGGLGAHACMHVFTMGGTAGNTMCDCWPQVSGMQGPPYTVCSHSPGLSGPSAGTRKGFCALAIFIRLHACAV